MSHNPSFIQVLEMQNRSIDLQVQHWLKYEIFTPQFWFLTAVLILPWIVWWKLVDKNRFLEIIIYGLFISTIVTLLDEIGCQLNWWEYLYDIEPLYPRLIPMNFTILPIIYMMLYQYFPDWKAFLVGSTVMSSVASFIFEPLLKMSGIYVLLEWKYLYSFPIYIILAALCKGLVQAAMIVSNSYANRV